VDRRDQEAIEGETPRPLVAPEKPKFGGGSMLIIGVCVAVAVLGIFVGVIVVYGGAHALSN
jgi:hypothetical protein